MTFRKGGSLRSAGDCESPNPGLGGTADVVEHKEDFLSESSIQNFYPVILAGGRGTRFWPMSRKRRAKQLLPLNSDKSMIQETV